MAMLCAVSGCTSMRSSDGGNVRSVPSVVSPMYKAEMKVGDTQVTGTAYGHTLFGIFSWGTYSGTADYAEGSVIQKAAFYDACKQNGADCIVGARYDIEQYAWPFSIYKKETVVVKGFPGQITGTTLMTPDEVAVQRFANDKPSGLFGKGSNKLLGWLLK